ncbi:hypothetical protein [Methylobacterium sp. D48H]
MVGEIFRRLAVLRAELGEDPFERSVKAVLSALGTVALAEAERRAAMLEARERPPTSGVRVSATARRLDADLWDPGDPE